MRMLEVKKTRKFNGKIYKWYMYEPLRSIAIRTANELRRQGTSARVVTQPGYYSGGCNIYIRDRK